MEKQNDCRFILFIDKLQKSGRFKKMLTERLKQNINVHHSGVSKEKGASKQQSMLYRAIQILKNEKQAVAREKETMQKNNELQKNQLQRQIEYHKKKIIEMAESNLLYNLVGNNSSSNQQQTQNNQESIVKLQLQVDHYKNIIKQRDRQITNLQQSNSQLQKKNLMTLKQKQKNMEISLLQKISHQERIQLLQKEVIGKKRIIEGLKNEINRISGIQKEVLKQQQNIVKRGKQMKKFQQQFQSYYEQNQKRYKNKIQALENQNSFLRKEFKKVVKQVKSTCKCEGQAEQWKQKLYKIGKQLAQARVQLQRNGINRDAKVAKKIRSPKDLKNSDSSIESLVFSDESSQSS